MVGLNGCLPDPHCLPGAIFLELKCSTIVVAIYTWTWVGGGGSGTGVVGGAKVNS